MTRQQKFLDRVLRGASDSNISFREICRLLKQLGFAERIRASHHIFTRDDVEEILNLQPRGQYAKPYQVKQVREVIIRYRLADQDQPPDEQSTEDQADAE